MEKRMCVASLQTIFAVALFTAGITYNAGLWDVPRRIATSEPGAGSIVAMTRRKGHRPRGPRTH